MPSLSLSGQILYKGGMIHRLDRVPARIPVTRVTPTENKVGCLASNNAPAPMSELAAARDTAVNVPVSYWFLQ